MSDAIAKVKSGNFAGIHVDLIARGHAVEAIPVLKEQFDKIDERLMKEKIAAALVRLGDVYSAFWIKRITA